MENSMKRKCKKMKIFRFMSRNEFFRYLNGELLINNTKHKEMHFKTESVGFCFLNYAQYNPEEMYHSLLGLVDDDICCIFETSRDNLKASYGRYAKTDLTNPQLPFKVFFAKEYCTTEYSKETFKLLKFSIPNWFNMKKWNWREL